MKKNKFFCEIIQDFNGKYYAFAGKRLTVRLNNQNDTPTETVIPSYDLQMSQKDIKTELLKRLAYYEDMNDQKRLFISPTGLGLKVYVWNCDEANEWADEFIVSQVRFNIKGEIEMFAESGTTSFCFSTNDIEKTVFLSEADALNSVKK